MMHSVIYSVDDFLCIRASVSVPRKIIFARALVLGGVS